MRFHRKSTEAATEDREHEERNKKAATRASALGRKYAQRGSGGVLPQQQFVEEVKPDGEKVMRTLWRAAFNLFRGHLSTLTEEERKVAKRMKARIRYGPDYMEITGEKKAEPVGIVDLKQEVK